MVVDKRRRVRIGCPFRIFPPASYAQGRELRLMDLSMRSNGSSYHNSGQLHTFDTTSRDDLFHVMRDAVVAESHLFSALHGRLTGLGVA